MLDASADNSIKLRHQAEFLAGPFIPQERTLADAFGVSLSGQNQTHTPQQTCTLSSIT
jgi:hypothetical protein